MKFTGHSGNDDFTGTAQHDVFNLASGGSDTASGLGGADTFLMGGALNPADRINGGAGNDTVRLGGEYANLVFKATTMVNVENLVLTGGHNYALTTADQTVASDRVLTVNAAALKAGDALTFNGTTETDGHFSIVGGAGNDVLTGGAQDDTFDLSHGGNDTARGGDGNDEFNMGAAFTAGDHIDGGSGDNNEIFLEGDYSKGLLFKAHMIQNIFDIQLQGNYSYNFTLDNSSLVAGQQLNFYDDVTSSAKTLHINASGLSNSSIYVLSGPGNDTITGGAGNDVLQGGRGADHLTGGGGHDVIFYGEANESTGANFDTVSGFNFRPGGDVFNMATLTTGTVDNTVNGGVLRTAHFDTDLASDIGASQLGAYHVVLFEPTGAAYAGDTFLIVDFNGVAGYQAGHDLVILLDHAAHIGEISSASFGQDIG